MSTASPQIRNGASPPLTPSLPVQLAHPTPNLAETTPVAVATPLRFADAFRVFQQRQRQSQGAQQQASEAPERVLSAIQSMRIEGEGEVEDLKSATAPLVKERIEYWKTLTSNTTSIPPPKKRQKKRKLSAKFNQTVEFWASLQEAPKTSMMENGLDLGPPEPINMFETQFNNTREMWESSGGLQTEVKRMSNARPANTKPASEGDTRKTRKISRERERRRQIGQCFQDLAKELKMSRSLKLDKQLILSESRSTIQKLRHQNTSLLFEKEEMSKRIQNLTACLQMMCNSTQRQPDSVISRPAVVERVETGMDILLKGKIDPEIEVLLRGPNHRDVRSCKSTVSDLLSNTTASQKQAVAQSTDSAGSQGGRAQHISGFSDVPFPESLNLPLPRSNVVDESLECLSVHTGAATAETSTPSQHPSPHYSSGTFQEEKNTETGHQCSPFLLGDEEASDPLESTSLADICNFELRWPPVGQI